MLTPQTKEVFLAQAIGVPMLYLKREDLHPYGSHKGRSIPYMMDHYAGSGTSRFAISSSGNAAFAAAMHATRLSNEGKRIVLDIFIGQKIHPEKEARLREYEKKGLVEIHKSDRPKQDLSRLCAGDLAIRNLRQSTDDLALTGYHALAAELLEIDGLSAVFMATSSGTTAQALHDKFLGQHKDIEIHIVQTTSCHPMSLPFDTPETSEQSVADAIVDVTAFRKIPVGHAVKNSNGSAWVATNSEIRKAQDLLKKYSTVEATASGALALAGLLRAHAKGRIFRGAIVCIISGK